MERSFHAQTPVLFQNPKHPINYKNPRKRWILVPMCAYKVMVPYPRVNALNLFQETVLKLLANGIRASAPGDPFDFSESQWIARALCLNEELVAFILKELQEKRLIDERRRVTEEGYQILKEGEDAYEMATGYVFYNYATKTYMDAFVPENQYHEVDTLRRWKNQIRFCTNDSAADPRPRTGTIVHVDTSADVEPDVYEILNICKRHSRRSKRIGFDSGEDEEHADTKGAEGRTGDLPRVIGSVRFLGSKKDLYVATYLFQDADDILNLSRMQACYPFGEGISPSILDYVERLAREPENEALRNEIIGLKEETNSLNDAELAGIRKSHRQAEASVRSVLSQGIERYPAVLRMLLSVEDSYRLVKGLIQRNKGSNLEIIKEKMREYIRNNYNLIASILTYTIEANGGFQECEVSAHPQQNAVYLTEYAKRLGFDDSEQGFERFFKLKRRTITESVREQHMSGLFAYNVICAKNVPGHPFYRLAREMPDLVNYLFLLRNLRNESSHANDVMYNFDKLREYRRKNMQIAYLLLEGLTFRKEKYVEEGDDARKISQVKAVREAQTRCEMLYTENRNRHSNIATQLRNLQYQVYIQGDDYPRCASEVFEAIFKAIAGKRISLEYADSFRDYSDEEENTRIWEEMQSLGFTVGRIPFYRKGDVTAVMRRPSSGTLMTLFYAWYFSEQGRGSGLMEKVAKRCPGLVRLLAQIHRNREHVGKMQFTDPRLEDTKAQMDGAVNHVLDVLAEAGIL